jgi:hypothetical protein
MQRVHAATHAGKAALRLVAARSSGGEGYVATRAEIAKMEAVIAEQAKAHWCIRRSTPRI